MITNERQYKISKAALGKLQQSIEDFDIEKVHLLIGDKTLAEAQLHALQSEHDILSDQLKEFEMLKSGAVADFRTESLDELPSLLVKARIAKGMSQRQLADRLGIKEQQVQRYEAEHYASASWRRIIEVATALNLDVRKHARLLAAPPTRASKRQVVAAEWSRFPLKEMYRRGWFPDFSGNLDDAVANADHLLSAFLVIAGQRWGEVLHRKHVRSGSSLDDYALLAWECRVLWLAQKEQTTTSFDAETITTEWIRALSELSAEDNSALRAKEYLRRAGITLVIEPHLPQTYLDGASITISAGKPIIGMTLRYDRLDNFWFVLLHEVAHLLLHLRKPDVKCFFDDLDAPPDELEKQADDFAGKALIPDPVWETAVARYLRTTESIQALADELRISPALIAGRIRKEANNYVILNELVGLGKVRRQFPEVKFGQ